YSSRTTGTQFFEGPRMANRTFASLAGLLFCCALCLSPTGRSHGDEGPAVGPKKLVVELWVVEVASDKLEKLGFGWEQLSPDGTKKFAVDRVAKLFADRQVAGDQLLGFLD